MAQPENSVKTHDDADAHSPFNLTIAACDGGEFGAYVALPESGKGPCVIMIQEIFGVNQEIRDKCDAMAAKGYVAVAPDLFWRIEPGISLVDSKEEELARAFELFGLFNVENGVRDLQSTVNALHAHEASTGLVGCVGYCLGGKLAYRMATDTDIDVSVSYYGVGIDGMTARAADIKKPFLMHIAGADEFVGPEAQAKIRAAFADHPHITMHTYAGMDHAFARGEGMHYNAEAAHLANDRTAAFLAKHLMEG